MIPNSNILPLAFYDSLQKQNARKWYVYGQAFEMPVPSSFLLPFQIIKGRTGRNLTSATIVRVSDGQETDILTDLQLTGLELFQPSGEDFELLIYPGTVAITYEEVGQHYLVLSDGEATWYSEWFCLVADLSDVVRIDYFHDEAFCVPSGWLRYQAPYKSSVYLCTDIGKPSYEYTEEVAERDGRNLKLKQVSIKRFKFNTILPEYLTDALRLIALHDYVEIYNYRDGRTYSVDEFDMNDPDWEEFGDLADVTFEFTTDTIVINAGRPLDSTAYIVQPGGCLAADHAAVSALLEGSSLYNNAQYLHSSGNIRNLQAAQKAVVEDGFGNLTLEQWSGTAWQSVALTNDDVVWVENANDYYVADTGQLYQPAILSYDDGTDTVTARALPNAYTLLYALTDSGNQLVGTYTKAEIEAGVVATLPATTSYIFTETQSANCSSFAKSNFFRIGGDPANEGVGFWVIEDDNIVQ